MNRNKILLIITMLILFVGLGFGINKYNLKKYEDKKQSIIDTHMSVSPTDSFDVEIIRKEKLVVYYEYIEYEDMGIFYDGYKYISDSLSNTHYTFQNEHDINVAHVYLSKDMTIHFISVNGDNVYENGDDKENNEYYEPIYKTIIEKTFGGELKEL